MKLFSRKRPVKATPSAKEKLGIAPPVHAVPLKGSDHLAEVTKALSLAEIAPPPPPEEQPKFAPGSFVNAAIPSDPGAHMHYAERAVEQMDAEEVALLEEIEQEKAASAAKLETLDQLLKNVRKTRAFYAEAAKVLAPEVAAPEPAAKPRKVRAHTKPEGQEAANE